MGHISLFQSTLLQGERHAIVTIVRIVIVISTHAPTRGATEKYNLTVKQITNVLKDEPSANQMTFEDYLKSCHD
jgi:Trp operon repressor